jgi:hypothetical protein
MFRKLRYYVVVLVCIVSENVINDWCTIHDDDGPKIHFSLSDVRLSKGNLTSLWNGTKTKQDGGYIVAGLSWIKFKTTLWGRDKNFPSKTICFLGKWVSTGQNFLLHTNRWETAFKHNYARTRNVNTARKTSFLHRGKIEIEFFELKRWTNSDSKEVTENKLQHWRQSREAYFYFISSSLCTSQCCV